MVFADKNCTKKERHRSVDRSPTAGNMWKDASAGGNEQCFLKLTRNIRNYALRFIKKSR
jgi:hypothetical protein